MSNGRISTYDPLTGVYYDPILEARYNKTVRAESGEASAYSKGNRVVIGDFAYIPKSDIGTCYVAGGAPGASAGQGLENVIGGNIANVNTSTSNLTDAPTLPTENGNGSAILWGYDNVNNGVGNILTGFRSSMAVGSQYSVITGGLRNKIAGISSSSINGGADNTVNSSGSVIGGGNNNVISSGTDATIVGGNSNATSAQGAAVLGGSNNTANGAYSTASGRYSVASFAGEQAQAVNRFVSSGDAQTSVMVLTAQTTSATAVRMTIDGANLVIPNMTTWGVRMLVVARRADAIDENACWSIYCSIKRNSGNTAALVGAPITEAQGVSTVGTWSVGTQVLSDGTVSFNCTGFAAKTINWVGRLEIVQVKS